MVLYQTRLGRHRIVVGYEANHKEFKSDPKDEEGVLYPFPVILAHPVGEEAPVFHEFKQFRDIELKMIIDRLNELFRDQKKSKAWVENFFSESALDPEKLAELEALEYSAALVEKIAAELKPIITPDGLYTPDPSNESQVVISDKMNKTDLLTFLSAHQVFDYTMENSKDDLLNAAQSLNAQIVADAQ